MDWSAPEDTEHQAEVSDSNVDLRLVIHVVFQITAIDSQFWVCWMGKSCGWKEYDTCCGSPSIPVRDVINK
jgi:hypothetical protein